MRTKRVNILSTTFDHNKQQTTINFENDIDTKANTLPNQNQIDKYLTMTGTIKRGKKKGQSMDIQLNLSRDEFNKINKNALLVQQEKHNAKQSNSLCTCTLRTGLHIFLLSIFALPFVVFVTIIYGFYIGTITWYNMFIYFNEEKTYLHKLIMSPLLILIYPIAIVLCTIGLGIYSGFAQITTKFGQWSNEICDIEKGFYGWLCSLLKLSDCSPYEVVILEEIKPNDDDVNTNVQIANTSTEELSL